MACSTNSFLVLLICFFLDAEESAPHELVQERYEPPAVPIPSPGILTELALAASRDLSLRELNGEHTSSTLFKIGGVLFCVDTFMLLTQR